MRVMSLWWLLLAALLSTVKGFDCQELVESPDTQYVAWANLEKCILETGGSYLPRKTIENLWRLVKIAFDGSENIPAEVFGELGQILTAISVQELRNISMESVEVVEAFGAIRKKEITSKSIDAKEVSFSEEQLRLIAKKVRSEWLGKSPETYSEYDLMSMGQIVCHLNVSDIAKLHADAFKHAAEWIGNLQDCPQDRLQAFATLAVRDDAFGTPGKWSKIVLSIIGNILNGLSPADIASIDKNKLYLNRYYSKQSRSNPKRSSSADDPTDGTEE